MIRWDLVLNDSLMGYDADILQRSTDYRLEMGIIEYSLIKKIKFESLILMFVISTEILLSTFSVLY